MSTKDWKNKEINTLLNERWGFSMDLGKLNEASKPDFLDLDKDGDKEESMKDAAEDAKLEEEVVEETACAAPEAAPEATMMVVEEEAPDEAAEDDLLQKMLDALTIEQLRAALAMKQGQPESE